MRLIRGDLCGVNACPSQLLLNSLDLQSKFTNSDSVLETDLYLTLNSAVVDKYAVGAAHISNEDSVILKIHTGVLPRDRCARQDDVVFGSTTEVKDLVRQLVFADQRSTFVLYCENVQEGPPRGLLKN